MSCWRARLSTAVESLLALLDAMDPDPDLEDGADTEPNCGGYGASATTDECEAEDEGDDLDEGELDEAELADLWAARNGINE